MKGALQRQGAAEYCGISLSVFRRTCPVRGLPLPGRGKRPIMLWRVVDLDAWLASLGDTKRRPRGKAA